MNHDELMQLARSLDFPLATPELLESNDFYGHATILKKFANIRSSETIKACIEHSPSLTDFIWNIDAAAQLPAMICCSKRRVPILSKATNKVIFAIGPYIHYCPSFLDTNDIASERRRLGKNLLAFPVHSTHWIDNKCDFDAFCVELNSYKKYFDSIRVCVSWKNILQGHDAVFMKHGFECVTAGHMFDPHFVPRLKSLLEISDTTVSNSVGTHIGYSIYLGKPHFLINIPYSRLGHGEILERDGSHTYEDQVINEILPIFSSFTDKISTNQYDVINHYWGLDQIRRPDELRAIVAMADEMFKYGPPHYTSGPHLHLERAIRYIEAGDYSKALYLINHIDAKNLESGDLSYIKALSLHNLNMPIEALQQIKIILKKFPGHKHAISLLKQIGTTKSVATD